MILRIECDFKFIFHYSFLAGVQYKQRPTEGTSARTWLQEWVSHGQENAA
jgi:hypothetical protein